MLTMKCTNRHLNDPSHRETFESAHSVMLAIFAAHSQKVEKLAVSQSSNPKDSHEQSKSFAEQAVPFYTQCLIDVRISKQTPFLSSELVIRAYSHIKFSVELPSR